MHGTNSLRATARSQLRLRHTCNRLAIRLILNSALCFSRPAPRCLVFDLKQTKMSSESDEDVPLAERAKKKEQVAAPKANGSTARKPPPKRKARSESESEDDEDSESGSGSEDDSGNDSDVPLAARKRSTPKKANATPAKKKAKTTSEKKTRNGKNSAQGSGKKMWDTLRHCGVLFPPEYQPHGVKMLYDGNPVDLTPEQEEVATMFAIMKETDYMNKPVFLKNFWEGFKEVLGKNHVIKGLQKCDFTAIYDHLMAERDKKKTLTKEEKEKIKQERDTAEAKYKVAYVDDRPEPVGNFRVEPPGLFRGRGDHPRMGMIKKRIYPRDIVINIGKGEPIPEHPYPGQTWKEVRHDNTVTWLAYWKDTISAKDYKYVFLGATSTFKADSDLAKYEKARKLKDIIGDVRKQYESDWESKDTQKRQMATALYFIDKLALRAGHEKDEDEADTVGCCTLKVENVELVPPHSIRFDFLGKDSIRYENTVEVDQRVYNNVEKFRRLDGHGKRKTSGDMLFDTFDATDLNKVLKNIMDGLSVKVFRTYNASITLDRLLTELEKSSKSVIVEEKKADYDKANKEVAILCNHQRSVPKTHGNQMEKLQEKLAGLNTELEELEEELRAAIKGKGSKGNPDSIRNKVERKKAQIAKMELAARVKEDLKTVALGTSKINYMDPRITVAWCKRNEVPIEKIFNKSLLAKFNWSMDVEPGFHF